MNFSERYWKWKRAFNRRKALIGKIFSTLLTLSVLAVVAYAAYNIHQSDLQRKALLNQTEDDSKIKTVKNYDYGEPGFNQVAENDKMILAADYTTGEIRVTEKASGMNWYSNPQDRDEDKLVLRRPLLNSQIVVDFVTMDKGIEIPDFDSNTYSVRKGTMTHELVENGVKFTFGFTTANVYIPVQYTLTEDGFQAEVLVNEITGVGSNPFMIKSIALLPYFGAGGLEDDGYLFVPDGSGALINFNNNKQAMMQYNEPVYGLNPTHVLNNQQPVKEQISLPVFGAKVNDHAFLGVITAGDACSTITAVTSRKNSSYNQVYANADLCDYVLEQLNGNHAGGVDSHTIDYRANQTEGANYTVRYFFLENEEANYTGMSKLYRDYLKKNGDLKDSELADEKYMVLDLIGAVSIQKYVMGVKKPVVTAMTTYNQVCEIVKELKAQGVENLIINYIGAMDGGLNNQMYNEVSTESALGSKKEFQNMVAYLKEQGVLLFLETNPIDLYEDGNGYKENRDSVKTFYNAYAFQYQYYLDTNAKNNKSRWHLLRPALVSEVTGDFVSTLSDWGIENVTIERMGESLFSDYNEEADKYISRTSVINLWRDTLKNADDATKYLMLHGGNAFTTAYADVITDVADSHSSFDMQDQSVPFYQLVFQENTLLTSAGINTTVDYEYAFLKALETGCSLKYNLIYGNVSDLVGTDYNTMVSYSYDYWKDLAAEQYKELQQAVGQLAGKDIINHTYLDKEVTMTQYDSAAVIVNYSDKAYNYEGNIIPSMDYLILQGGAQ